MALLKYSESHQLRSYKKQATVLYQGEIPHAAYIIKKGIVRAFNILENGSERTVELLAENDILAAHWIFGNSNTALYYYDAFTDVSLLAIPKEKFHSYLKNDPEFSQLVTESLGRRYTASTMHTNALLQSSGSTKIAQILQFLVLSNGKKLSGGRYQIAAKISQQDIANLVGVSRETATLELNKLRDKGIISYKSFTYTVDYDALIRLGGGDEFIGLDI